MPAFRLALANIPLAATAGESVVLAERAIDDASAAGADLVCFPESYVPGYRAPGRPLPPPDADFLERAWSSIAAAAAKGSVAVILGTERLVDAGLLITALVIDKDGQPGGIPGQSADRSVGGNHLRVWRRAACLSVRCADLRHRDLPRGVAVPGNRALGRKARRANRLPSTRARGRSLAATVP